MCGGRLRRRGHCARRGTRFQEHQFIPTHEPGKDCRRSPVGAPGRGLGRPILRCATAATYPDARTNWRAPTKNLTCHPRSARDNGTCDGGGADWHSALTINLIPIAQGGRGRVTRWVAEVPGEDTLAAWWIGRYAINGGSGLAVGPELVSATPRIEASSIPCGSDEGP